jgi:hypothetical protein
MQHDAMRTCAVLTGEESPSVSFARSSDSAHPIGFAAPAPLPDVYQCVRRGLSLTTTESS